MPSTSPVRCRRRIACRRHVSYVRSLRCCSVIVNGDVFTYEDIARIRERTGAHSVMIARGAQWNPSVFRKDGPVPVWDVMSEYLQLCQTVGNTFANSKYTLMQMKASHCPKPMSAYVNRTKTFDALRADLLELKTVPALSGPYSPPITLIERDQMDPPLKKQKRSR